MPRGRGRGSRRPVGKGPGFELDQFSAAEVVAGHRYRKAVHEYHAKHFNELAIQRSRVEGRLHAALLAAAEADFTFSRWQRVVKYRYSNCPLAVLGNLSDPAGGRFNIGRIDPNRFPVFPGLYLAENRRTAMAEALSAAFDPAGEHTALEAALTDRESMSIVEVSGRLDTVINLSRPERLKEFMSILAGFEVSAEVERIARDANITRITIFRTVDQLIAGLGHADWRSMPLTFDVPSAGQIFGQLVSSAGITGIRYPSRFTGDECLVVFTRNLVRSSSFVALDGALPTTVRLPRLDAGNAVLAEHEQLADTPGVPHEGILARLFRRLFGSARA